MVYIGRGRCIEWSEWRYKYRHEQTEIEKLIHKRIAVKNQPQLPTCNTKINDRGIDGVSCNHNTWAKPSRNRHIQSVNKLVYLNILILLEQIFELRGVWMAGPLIFFPVSVFTPASTPKSSASRLLPQLHGIIVPLNQVFSQLCKRSSH